MQACLCMKSLMTCLLNFMVAFIEDSVWIPHTVSYELVVEIRPLFIKIYLLIKVNVVDL